MDDETVCQRHSAIESEIKRLQKDTDEQWTAINQLRNRPPVWVTFLISGLTFGFGAALTYASFAARLALAGKL